ncbi:hypothetical protein VNO78_21162 [Psophocarpus tetragonolobus]|uniref:Protein kinase domain-containing protein n=1 Tax=Psophocarpus tetragonolobus TaxID=3891 RepID=A0AAN9SBR6_PSOTE
MDGVRSIEMMSDMTVDAEISFICAVQCALSSGTASNFAASSPFVSVVDNAIRSGTASYFETSHVHGFASTVDNAMKSGTESNFPVHGFASAVNNAIKSETTASNFGTSHVHGFASTVDNGMKSGTESNFPVHGFASVVNNAIRSGTTYPLHDFASTEGTSIVSAAEMLQLVSNVPPRLFTLTEIKAATNNFSRHNVIGAGSFGVVYRGKLVDGRMVAIKKGRARSKRMSPVKSDLDILSHFLPHKHLVGVVGYCREENNTLMFEYMENGSLYGHLHDKSNVEKGSSVLNSWKMRIKIALDVSRGIQHLHNHSTVPYVHGDIKSSNILLDATWTARVSDFVSLTKASGTTEYIDPEYYDLNVLTAKSDVYGFGVVLLELLTGKKAILVYGEDGSPSLSLVEVVVPALLGQDLVKILDPKVGAPDVGEALAVELVAYTAIHCVSLEGKSRLTMAHIVLNLEHALAISNSNSDSISRMIRSEK